MDLYEKHIGPRKSYLRCFDRFDLYLPQPDNGFRWGRWNEVEVEIHTPAKIQFDVASNVILFVLNVSENEFEPTIKDFDLAESARTDAFLEFSLIHGQESDYSYTKWLGSKLVKYKGKTFLFSECIAYSQGEDLVRVFWLRFSVEDQNFVVKGSFPSSETDIWRKYLLQYAFPVSFVGITKTENDQRNVQTVFSHDEVSDQRLLLLEQGLSFSENDLANVPKSELPKPVEIDQIWEPGIRDFLDI